MRVNPNLTPDLLAALNITRQTTEDALLELASGRRVNRPSDDPAASAILVQNHDQTVFTNRYVQTLSSIQGRFQTADSALSSVILAMTHAITLGVEAANGPLNDANRAAIVVELQGIQAELVSLANTSFEGTPLFKVQLSQQENTLASADIESAASRLVNSQAATNATLAAIGKISQLNLLDFLQ